MSLTTCEVTPTTLQGSQVALYICGIEVPIDKADLKRMAKKTEITSSVSYYNGVIWEEYSPGPSGGSLNWDSKWRVNQTITPPDVRPGAIYPVAAYVRRPGTTGPSDPGSAYTMNLFVESNDVTFDPRAGVIEWKCSGTATGPIINPS